MLGGRRLLPLLAVLALGCPPLVAAEIEDSAVEPVDLDTVNRIRDEGFHHSRVMETLGHLTDSIGPRLTGSPGMREANEWTREQLEKWGLERARLESWGEFGLGWSFSRTSVHLLAPRSTPLSALPKAWTPGTDGVVEGRALQVTLEDEEDLEKWKGKVAGKVLFLDSSRDPKVPKGTDFERYSREDLDELTHFPVPGPRDDSWMEKRRERYRFSRVLNQFSPTRGRWPRSA